MNHLKRTFILVLMAFTLSICAYSQNSLSYSYDAAGNRTGRSIMVTQVKGRDTTDIEEVDDTATSRLRITANSKSGIVKVHILDYTESDHCRITLYDSGGITLTDISAKKPLTNIDLNGKPIGVYILQTVLNGKESIWKIAYG